ncbi:hypothetical protein V5799_011645, partial [Amblyomma americanum]
MAGGSSQTSSLTDSHVWVDDDVERLIGLVQANPALYDMTLPEYKDKGKRNLMWTAIGIELGIDGEQCKKKWTYLRDKFLKVVSKPPRSGSSGGSTKRWAFFNLMSFLHDHAAGRSALANYESSSQDITLLNCSSAQPQEANRLEVQSQNEVTCDDHDAGNDTLNTEEAS